LSEKKKAGRPVGRPPATATRKRILDAAEVLFAERGYDGVTVRQITAEAGVDTALAHHHFGSKQDLFARVLLRRAEVHMKERDQAMSRCIEEAGGAPTLRDVLLAYVRPYLDRARSSEKGWRTYFKLLAKANTSPEWASGVFDEQFDPFVRRFIDAMRRAVPDVPEERYFWAYHFLSGALVLTFADTGRIDRLSGGVCSSSDFETGFLYLIPFMEAGVEAILRGDRPLPELAGSKPVKKASKSSVKKTG